MSRGLSWLVVPLLAAAAGAQDGSDGARLGHADLRVGQWVRVKGALDGKRFRAEVIELMQPDDDQSLTGTVERMKTPTRLMLLGQEVHLSAKTEYSGVAPGDLTGKRVKVQGDYRGPRKFSADTVRARGEGRDAIEGRIDALDLRQGGAELWITRYRVWLGPEAEFELEEDSLEELELAALVEFSTSDDLRVRDDDDDIARSLQLGDGISLGGQYELRAQREDNNDLNDARAADQTTYDTSLRLEAVWEPNEQMYFLGGVRTQYRWREDEDDPDFDDETTVVNELYGYFRDVGGSGWDLQVGRQDFDERREWLYDQNLDAVRGIRSTERWRLELSVSSVLADGNRRDEANTNLLAYLSNNDQRRHLGVYALHREVDSEEFTTHMGSRLFGNWLPSHWSWAELAVLRGEDGLDREGHAIDLGTTWAPEGGPLEGLSLTLGYALGSGDDDLADGDDRSFRQTGLHDNNGRFNGVTSFRYYGELFDPELSNLGILTVGLGLRPGPRSSLDLVYHRYEQEQAVDRLFNTELRRRPNGNDTDLGWGLDLVYGNRSFGSWSLELIGSYFEPGDAFDDADPAWGAKFQLRRRF